MSKAFYDCRYQDYDGAKRWRVTHSAYQNMLICAAPDENSAIVAAAEFWGETWTKISFYANCVVNKA